MSLETLVVLITSVETEDANYRSSVSTIIAVYLTTTPHATAGDRLDLGLQEKLLGTRLIYRSNVQRACVTIVSKSVVKTASLRLSHEQK